MPVRLENFSWKNFSEGLSAGNVTLYDCDPHFHETYTIGLVRNGKVSVELNKYVYELSSGDIFLIHPYQVHAGGNQQETINCDIIYPTVEQMAEAMGISIRKGEFPLFKQSIIRANPETIKLAEIIDMGARRDPRAAKAQAFEQVRKLFQPLLAEKQGLAALAIQHPAIAKACNIMLNDWECLSNAPANLWQSVGVSKFHFNRLFREVVGIPPGVFLRQLRVARACELISTGERLANIAIDVGFYDQSHLNKEFNKVFGFPPSQYAKQWRRLMPSADTAH